MKKVLGILIRAAIISSCAIVGCNAYDNNAKLQELKQQQQQMKKYLPYYQNLATCTPHKNDLYQIYGKVNGNCHVYLVDTIGIGRDCSIPMSVAEVNSNYGKKAFGKIANMNLDKMFQEENIERSISELTILSKDIQTLSQLESTMIQYHCKMKL